MKLCILIYTMQLFMRQAILVKTDHKHLCQNFSFTYLFNPGILSVPGSRQHLGRQISRGGQSKHAWGAGLAAPTFQGEEREKAPTGSWRTRQGEVMETHGQVGADFSPTLHCYFPSRTSSLICEREVEQASCFFDRTVTLKITALSQGPRRALCLGGDLRSSPWSCDPQSSVSLQETATLQGTSQYYFTFKESLWESLK